MNKDITSLKNDITKPLDKIVGNGEEYMTSRHYKRAEYIYKIFDIPTMSINQLEHLIFNNKIFLERIVHKYIIDLLKKVDDVDFKEELEMLKTIKERIVNG
jgi:hypothetical protein